jgi:hypothetical protein
MCVQYLKLAEQAKEDETRVLVDFQSNKFEAEVFDDGINNFC